MSVSAISPISNSVIFTPANNVSAANDNAAAVNNANFALLLADSITSASDTGLSPDVTAATTQGDTSLLDIVDLSPDAQNILDAISGNPTNNVDITDTLPLTAAQQTQVNNIFQQFEGVPFSESVFVQIETELQNAGLSPEQLLIEQALSNMQPGQTLLDALNGILVTANNFNNTGVLLTAQEQQQELNTILSQFNGLAVTQNLFTTVLAELNAAGISPALALQNSLGYTDPNQALLNQIYAQNNSLNIAYSANNPEEEPIINGYTQQTLNFEHKKKLHDDT